MVDSNYQKQDPGNPVEGAYVQPSPGIVEQVVTVADDAGVSAFGAAGTESAAVLTVQGTASGTPIPVSGTGLGGGVAQASTTSGQVGTLVQGATTTTAPTYTTGKTNPLSTTTAGRLRVQRARDAQITVQAGSTAAAPAAAATVATVTPGTAGLWEITGTVAISGTTVAAADSNNMRLSAAGSTVLANIPIGVQATTGSPGSYPFGPVVVNLAAPDTVTVTAVSNATASSVYAASIVARLVGG